MERPWIVVAAHSDEEIKEIHVPTIRDYLLLHAASERRESIYINGTCEGRTLVGTYHGLLGYVVLFTPDLEVVLITYGAIFHNDGEHDDDGLPIRYFGSTTSPGA